MLLLLTTALAGPCDANALSAHLDRAETAFTQDQAKPLGDALQQARRHLDCAVPDQVARYFRAEALHAHLQDAPKRVESALAASLSAHPLLPFPTDLLTDPTLERAVHRAQERPLRYRAGPPRLVNGLRAPLVPVAKHVGRRPGRGLVVAGLGVGAITAGLYAASWSSRKTFDRTAGLPAVERLPSYRATNRLSIASLTGAVAGGSLLTLGLVL